MLRAIQEKQQENNQANQNNSNNSIDNSSRNIENLTEDELLEEFSTFLTERQRLSSTSIESNNTNTNKQWQLPQDGTSVGEEIEYLNALTEAELQACPRTFLTLGGNKLRHLVDTGTNLNIISSTTFKGLKTRPILLPTKVKAFGFHSRTVIPLMGEFTSEVKFFSQSIMARYLVLNGVADDIIGYSTATALGIVSIKCDNNPTMIRSINYNWTPSFRVRAMNFVQLEKENLNTNNSADTSESILDHNTDIHASYPTLFDGSVGKLKDFKVTLRVDPNVKPVQQPAYPVEFALLEMTKAKLDKLVTQDIISRVNGEQVTWVCPLHPVAKFDEQKNLVDVRITCNAKTFNKALLPH